MTAQPSTEHDGSFSEIDLPALHHVGLVVFDLATLAADSNVGGEELR